MWTQVILVQVLYSDWQCFKLNPYPVHWNFFSLRAVSHATMWGANETQLHFCKLRYRHVSKERWGNTTSLKLVLVFPHGPVLRKFQYRSRGMEIKFLATNYTQVAFHHSSWISKDRYTDQFKNLCILGDLNLFTFYNSVITYMLSCNCRLWP